MLEECKELQNRAVNELYNITIENKIREITFKAPTGSGKTYMMAKYMNRILEKDNDVIFIVSTLSKGDLAKQNYDKFIEYSENKLFSNINPYLINSDVSNEENLYIPTNYNVYVLPRDLYKKNTLLMKGPMESFLKDLTMAMKIKNDNIVLSNCKKIYLIKDECHQATNNLDSLSNNYFSKIINFSATPNLKRGQYPDVEISTAEAVNCKLIKQIVDGKIDDTLQDAVNIFKKVKNEYIKKLQINPCMIIQVSNKDKAKEELDEIIPILNKNDLKWMYIVNELKDCDTNDVFKTKKLPTNKWRDYAKESLSTIDVVIFKLTISEGWDIPRACMLYQKRDVQSNQLNEQVIGRVRRNPRLLNFEKLDEDSQHLAMNAYIWANYEKEQSIKSVEIKNIKKVSDEFKIKTTRLRNLKTKKNFDLDKIIKDNKNILNYDSIFDIYRNLISHNNDICNMCDEYSKNYDDWFRFNNSIDSISLEYNKQICDYEKNMVLYKDENDKDIFVTLPKNSSYARIPTYEIGIRDWVWKNIDEDNDFSFESYAEKKWAEVLKDLSSWTLDKNYKKGTERIIKSTYQQLDNFEYLWGKNYLQNSEIKFEYYLNGRHFSYPDFIMKDSYDNIHIFEVKSINKSKNFFDINENNQYDEKIAELKKCYKTASKLTGYIFYLPLLTGKDWAIHRYKNGNEKSLSFQQFKEHIINNN